MNAWSGLEDPGHPCNQAAGREGWKQGDSIPSPYAAGVRSILTLSCLLSHILIKIHFPTKWERHPYHLAAPYAPYLYTNQVAQVKC